jgi:hypothetical protein
MAEGFAAGTDPIRSGSDLLEGLTGRVEEVLRNFSPARSCSWVKVASPA